ncbi:hypothetical protein NDU88_001995 [Pleurodeles waltl]|uniref:Uncharacterized protein n=1 Tax=Pleurodeles waltl TaxID=8319 RepID=A0AAV7Q5A6_PLEWA|nr:hypothetical protein NDU88_001995 [Pleurodeles waltl]
MAAACPTRLPRIESAIGELHCAWRACGACVRLRCWLDCPTDVTCCWVSGLSYVTRWCCQRLTACAQALASCQSGACWGQLSCASEWGAPLKDYSPPQLECQTKALAHRGLSWRSRFGLGGASRS